MALDVNRVAAAPLTPFTGQGWRHLGARQAIGVEGLLPRKLYRYDVALDQILDLTSGEVRAQVGLGLDVLTGPDWTACQELGSTVHSLGAQGISSPSATGVGETLAVFVQQVGLGWLVPQLTEEWHSARQLDGQLTTQTRTRSRKPADQGREGAAAVRGPRPVRRRPDEAAGASSD